MIVSVVAAIIIAAIAYFLLKADRVAPDRAAIYAVAFAIVFVAGALTHSARNAAAVTESPRDTAARPAGPASLGALDAADVDATNILHVRGWALGVNSQPASKVTAIVDGATQVDITKSYGRSRPDVAASLKQPGVKDSGYDGTVSLAHLKPGNHQVSISVTASDGATVTTPANSTRTFSER